MLENWQMSTIEVHRYASSVVTQSGRTLAEAHGLSRQLFAVAERARNDFAAVVSGFGLTPVQARAVLWLESPSAMRDLAGHLNCDASNVTGVADRLESLGLVQRRAGEDRRVKLLQLTAAGETLRAELADRVARASTVTARLTRAERAQLRAILDKLMG